MLSRVQAEERVEIIKNIKMKDKNLRERLERDSIDNASSSPIESNFPEGTFGTVCLWSYSLMFFDVHIKSDWQQILNVTL